MKKYVFRKYSREFPAQFQKWKRKLSRVLPSRAQIEHFGSTAVPGLGGKGIIDIIVLVKSNELEKASKALQAMGFEYKPHPGRSQRLFFQLDFRAKNKPRRAHVHLTSSAKVFEIRIAARDLLKSDSEARKEYASIKKKAARLCMQDKRKYGAFKEKFLRNLERRALRKRQ